VVSVAGVRVVEFGCDAARPVTRNAAAHVFTSTRRCDHIAPVIRLQYTRCDRSRDSVPSWLPGDTGSCPNKFACVKIRIFDCIFNAASLRLRSR